MGIIEMGSGEGNWQARSSLFYCWYGMIVVVMELIKRNIIICCIHSIRIYEICVVCLKWIESDNNCNYLYNLRECYETMRKKTHSAGLISSKPYFSFYFILYNFDFSSKNTNFKFSNWIFKGLNDFLYGLQPFDLLIQIILFQIHNHHLRQIFPCFPVIIWVHCPRL